MLTVDINLFQFISTRTKN